MRASVDPRAQPRCGSTVPGRSPFTAGCGSEAVGQVSIAPGHDDLLEAEQEYTASGHVSQRLGQVQRVAAEAAVQHLESIELADVAHDDGVVAWACGHGVAPRPRVDGVIAEHADDDVVTGVAVH